MNRVFRLAILLIAVAAALLAKAAKAESDITPPVVISIDVEPTYIDTSTGAQTITVTAHIIDNLSGCPVNDWCLNFFFVPLLGPENQAKSNVLSYSSLISGTLINGIYSATIELPQYSYEGRWVLDRFLTFDNVRNRCFWVRSSNNEQDSCTYGLKIASFVNRIDDTPKLLYIPLVNSIE